MPIVNLCDATHEGAVGHHYGAGLHRYDPDTREYVIVPGPMAYWTYLSHQGLCLAEREMNGYNDSDFFMTVWDTEKHEPKEIMFATTRGWSYPCLGSRVDATEEVRALYEQWGHGARWAAEIERRALRAVETRQWRRELQAAAKAHGARYTRLLKLRRTLLHSDLQKVVKLLTSKVRSQFKLGLRQQVIAWTLDPNPKYATPLSKKQLEYLDVGGLFTGPRSWRRF